MGQSQEQPSIQADTTDQPQPGGAGALPPAPPPEKTPVLERLGSSPFPRGKFPFIGVLASIYEHVGELTRRRYNSRP
jgi:hypothetical protein